MKIIDLSQCKTDLDFQPLRKWPAPLPVLVFQGQILAGFERAGLEMSGVELDSSAGIIPHLVALYPELSSAEFLMLWSKLQQTTIHFDKGNLFSAFNFRYREAYGALSQELSAAPSGLQKWLAEKAVGFFELESIFPLPTNSSTWLQLFVSFNPSRADGVKALENFKELKNFNYNVDELIQAKDFKELQDRFFKARYPMRSEQINRMTGKSKKVSWPKHAQTRWNFDVDQPSLELKLKLQSAADVEKVLVQLGAVTEQLQKEDNNPWA